MYNILYQELTGSHAYAFENPPTAVESTFLQARLNQLCGAKRHERTAHLSKRVNLSDLGLEYFVDCEGFKFVKMTAR